MVDEALLARTKPFISMNPARPRTFEALVPIMCGVAGLAILLLVWWIATDWLASERSFGRRFSPEAALPALWELVRSGQVWVHVDASLRRVTIGLSAAVAVGVPIGVLVGASKLADRLTTPAFQFLRMVSPLSWMPIAVIILGVGDLPIYFLLAVAAVWPIILNTAAGVRQLDPHWLLLAQSLAATRSEVFSRIMLPGLLGPVLTGLRLSIGVCWIVLVPCEMLGVQEGLGYLVLDSRDRLAYDELMATVLAVGAIGFALDCLSRAVAGRFAFAR